MDWIRENKPLAAILGVIVVGSVGLGYLLFDAWGAYTQTKDNYLAMGGQLVALKSAPLAPTDENVKAKRALVDEYAAKVNQLGAALLIMQPQVQPMKDIEFQDKLKNKIAETRKAAGQVKMALPADFAFGFEEYTSALPKTAAAATELSGYLDALEELVKLFMACRVESVDLFERAKLKVETDTAAAQPTAAQSAEILAKHQISVILTLDQGPLQLLISRLSNPSEMKYFMNVRLLRIENEKLDGPLRSDVRLPDDTNANANADSAAPPAGQEAAPAAAANSLAPPPPAKVDSIPVLGEERLKVRLDIDWVKFLAAAKGAAAR